MNILKTQKSIDMRKLFKLFLALMVLNVTVLRADEGMWLINLIGQYHMDELQEEGLQLSAEDIYNVNHSSLKDAMVAIDHGMCTGEFVSSQGLFLTNHHCAYGEIQNLSSTERNYLENGFWASSYEEEIPIEGKSVSLLHKVEDVTGEVKKEVQKLKEAGNDGPFLMRKAYRKVETAAKKGTDFETSIASMFEGDKYYLFYYMTYTDVRMVGFPPSSIGYFGGETDNWMWPQHKGDFAMYRVYADKNGKPAEYSKDNVPFEPENHLEISLEGVEEGDFTMVIGYPYSTDRYLTSFGVNELMTILNPPLIDIREDKLEIMKEAMDSDPELQIKYADKYFNASNVYKLTVGQNKFLKEYDLMSIKKGLEQDFIAWVNKKSARKAKYKGVLDSLEVGYERLANYQNTEKYFREGIIEGCDLLKFALKGKGLQVILEKNDGLTDKKVNFTKRAARKHFKNYDKELDRKLFINGLKSYVNNVDKNHLPEELFKMINEYHGDYKKFADYVYSNTFFADSTKLFHFLENPSLEVLRNDPAYKVIYKPLNIVYDLRDKFEPHEDFVKHYQKLFVEGLLQMQDRKNMYPDANSTMRLTYGTVGGYSPEDAVVYDFYTTADGYLAKENPDENEFNVHEEYKKLLLSGDYGRYADKEGKLRIDFVSDNDITGGNSGSPVLNKKGQLVGIAFDGNWESLTSDVYFHPDYNKTISVDIRYVLFIVDKYAGADRLIEEMTIVD